jgi:hypothetical protein
MANPTTNYGFVLPTPTDLVTDLPADFDVALQGVDTRLKALQPGTTLGDIAYSSATANTNTRLAIGSTGQVLTVASGLPSWATPVSAPTALVYVGGASFTTSSSQSFNNVFTSTYQNYMVVVNTEQSALITSNFRLRVSGADNTTSNYYSNATYNQIDAAGGDTDVKASATTTWATNNTAGLNQVYYIHSPQSTLKTFLSSNQIGFIYTPNFYTGRLSGLFNATTSFDGFTFFPGTGTMTGNIRIYGIANS